MDRVRFGRALGYGARAAAKTLVSAVDAATAENPSARKPTAEAPRTASTPPVARYAGAAPTATPAAGTTAVRPLTQVVQTAAKTAERAQAATKAVRRGRKRFGQAALEPVVRLSGVVALEVAGVFFGIFALVGLGAIWRLHGAWRTSAPEHQHLLGAVAMLVVFGYFCISSFVRARRREKRR